MNIYVKSGVPSLDIIIKDYNKFSMGGELTFKEAYREARKRGEETFVWKGREYTTELKGEASKAPAQATTQLQPQPQPTQGFSFDVNRLSREQYKAAKATWDYMKSKKVSPRNAAAIMGNMMQESSFDSTVVQKGGDRAIGYFQLHGQRLKDYNDFLKENNMKDSPESQIDYILDVSNNKRKDYYIADYNRVKNHIATLKSKPSLSIRQQAELNDYEKYFNSIYGKRESTNTLYPIADFTEVFNDDTASLEDVTSLFTNTIERAGKPEHAKRQGYAKAFYDHFNK